VKRGAKLEAQLAGVPLFSSLSSEQLRDLRNLVVRSREAAGTPLMRRGERGDELVVLLEGSVEIRRDGVTLATLGPGSYLGEIALINDRAVRTADAVAVTPVTIAYLGRHEFAQLFAASPEFALAILHAAATRLAEAESPGV
jgi:CRP-like cAMP-binding protein